MKTKQFLGLALRGHSTLNGELTVLAVGAMVLLAQNVTAQQFTILHSFTGGNDGSVPVAGVILSTDGSTLYGTASQSGIESNASTFGTAYSLTADPIDPVFTTLHTFNVFGRPDADGENPLCALVLSPDGTTLYGTTDGGGVGGGWGTVFSVPTDGNSMYYEKLYSFADLLNNGDGATPCSGVVLSPDGTTLYGTTDGCTECGSQAGTLYSINTDGTPTLNVFDPDHDPFPIEGGDGLLLPPDIYPDYSPLILSGNTLYGTSYLGGSNECGYVFSISTDGSGFTDMYDFSGGANDGKNPVGALCISGGFLYGTTIAGGPHNTGTIFAIGINPVNGKFPCTIMHIFLGEPNDGAEPTGGLCLLSNNTLNLFPGAHFGSGGTLYGTTIYGGTNNTGTIFAISINAVNGQYPFSVKYSFTNACLPNGGLAIDGFNLYGTTVYGGTNNEGSVYTFDLNDIAIPVTHIVGIGPNGVELTWFYVPYVLQSAFDVNGPYTNVLVNGLPATSPYTNAANYSQQFFTVGVP